jgi:hypothetical protein
MDGCVLCNQQLDSHLHGHTCRSTVFTEFAVDASAIVTVDNESFTPDIRGDVGVVLGLIKPPRGSLRQTVLLVGKTGLPVDERGVFSVGGIRSRTRILEYSGAIMDVENEKDDDDSLMNTAVSVDGVHATISPILVGGIACLINGAHEHRVNCYTVETLDGKGVPRIFMTTGRDVEAGDELFWDYDATCNVPHQEMECLCGCGGKLVTFSLGAPAGPKQKLNQNTNLLSGGSKSLTKIR